MIEHPDLYRAQRLFKLFGDVDIGLTWLGNARRVVVGENDRCCVVMQRAFHDLPRVNRSAIERADKQFLELHYVVLAIEKQAAEHFPRAVAIARPQLVAGGSRAFQHVQRRQRRGQMTMGQLAYYA